MKVSFDIQINGSTIIVEDTTKYITEDTTKPNTFKKSEVLPIIVIQNDKGDIKYSFSNQITIDIDGKYTVYYILIPTAKYARSIPDVAKNVYTNFYYTDGEYIYNKTGTKEDIDILVQNVISGTTISRDSKEVVSIGNMYECYINLCKQIFNNRMFTSCFAKSNIDSELIYKRDIVWMAINVINYLVEKDELEEAARYIQIIQGCNGICSNNSIKNDRYEGCGCSKR